MANVHETAAQAVRRAKTVISRAKRKGEELGTEFAKKPAVKQARKKVEYHARPLHWPAS